MPKASRFKGFTAAEVATVHGCTEGAALELLKLMAAAGLVWTVPRRKARDRDVVHFMLAPNSSVSMARFRSLLKALAVLSNPPPTPAPFVKGLRL